MLTIGRYEIIRELGRGGMATVHLALDPSFGRRVAIKVLPRHMLHETEFRARFEREAKIIAALEHPYIVPVYDYGEDAGQPFIVMRYMPGGTLAERIAGRSMPLVKIIPTVQRLAEALDEAHSHDIVHRDLKPSNVMFDGKSNAFLSDFGLAKMLESSTMLTATGVMGTPAYMSPEQAMGGDLDSRSDVYSLGVILYEMLTGQQPYSAKTPAAMMMKHVTGPVPPINVEALGLPAKCNSILNHALAKEMAARYQTAWELAEALNTLGVESGVKVPSRPRPPAMVLRLPVKQNGPGTSVGTEVISPVAGQPLTMPKSWYQRLSRRGWIGVTIGLAILAFTPMVALAMMAGNGLGRRTPTPTSTAPPSATPAPSPTLAPTAIPPTFTPFVVTVIATVPTATPIPTETPTDTPIPPTETEVFVPTRTRRPPTIVPTDTPPPPTPTDTLPPPSPTDIPASTNPPPPPTTVPPTKTPRPP